MTLQEVYSQAQQLSASERVELLELLYELDRPPLPTFSTEEELDALLIEGLDSGFVVADDAFWEGLRKRAIERKACRPASGKLSE
jgi:hypothetical protein